MAMILLLSKADSHNVDQSGSVNRHEIPLLSKIDSHAMNRYHWVTETQIGSVPKKPSKKKKKKKTPKLETS